MKMKLKLKTLTALALGTFLALTPSKANAKDLDMRLRHEFTETKESRVEKSTIGISPKDTCLFAEIFRAYNTRDTNGNDKTEWGLTLTPKNKRIKSEINLFGARGEKESENGLGTEIHLTHKNTTAIVNYETTQDNSKRIGGGLRGKYKNWRIGVGHDKLHHSKNPNLNSTTINTTYKQGKDFYGAGLNKTSQGNTKTKNATGFATIKRDWGALRNILFYTQTKTNNSKESSFKYTWMFSQNPNFFADQASTWAVQRTHRDGSNYNNSLINSANMYIERVPLGWRATDKGGFVSQGSIKHNNSTQNSWAINASAGYNFPIKNGLNVTPTLSYTGDFQESESKETLGTSLLVDMKAGKGKITLEAITDTNEKIYTSATFTYPF